MAWSFFPRLVWPLLVVLASMLGPDKTTFQGDPSTPQDRSKYHQFVVPEGPVLTIVIDDVGSSVHQLLPFLQLDQPLTYAILPQLADSEESVELFRQIGASFILHQPMEALGGNDPGPGAIFVNTEFATIPAILETNVVPMNGIKGFNNHMGSRITEQAVIMDQVLEWARNRGLYFLDSRTSGKSVGFERARALGVPALRRDVFLDNVDSPEAIRSALAEGVEKAHKNGFAVLIGHVWSRHLPDVLAAELPLLQVQGFVVWDLDMLAKWQGSAP